MSGFTDFSKKKPATRVCGLLPYTSTYVLKLQKKRFRRDQIVQCLRVICYGQIIPKGMET